MVADILDGPRSLRVSDEKAALVLSILLAPLTIVIIGTFFHEVSVSAVVLLIIGGLVYVSITRGRLLGASVHVHSGHFPELFAVVERVSARLGVRVPEIFVRDDFFVPVAALGTGEPYALVFSNYYVEHFTEPELEFLTARELAHIAAGHTRLMSLLSASGRENPVSSVIFGAWLRRTEYTADRVALACTGSLEGALSAISIVTFHTLGRRIDMRMLIEQQHEIDADPAFRMGEWASSMPYATKRIISLRNFASTELAQSWMRAIESGAPRPVPIDTPEEKALRVLAPRRRRIAAYLIDFAAIVAAFHAGAEATVTEDKKSSGKAAAEAVKVIDASDFSILDPHHALSAIKYFFSDANPDHVTLSFGAPIIYAVYAAILIGLNGQTLGMMILNIRVVNTKFGRVGFVQSAWRYIAAGLTVFAVPLALVLRVLPHDYLSRSRVVTSEVGASRRKGPRGARH